MRKILSVSILVLGLALAATAGPIETFNMTFASGATFTGQVTFTNDYSSVTAVNGLLSGGSYGSDPITWVFDPSYNYASSFGPQYGGNFLMDGTNPDFTNFIATTWDFSGAPNFVFANPGGVLGTDSVGGNNIDYNDPMVSGTISSSPEPASLTLIGLGVLGLGLIRRRR